MSTLVKATLRKADCMEEQNLLFLMTTPNSQIMDATAQPFIQLWREKELEKLLEHRALDKAWKDKESADQERMQETLEKKEQM